MYQMVHSAPMKRQDLLTAVIDDLTREGLGDRSLRDIAAAVGTSHRMLIHHFGSRHGLMTGVVEAIEEDQKRFMESLQGASGDIPTAMWQRLRDPELWPAERLFFECYARALHGEEPFSRLLPGAIDDWVERTVALDATPEVPPALARASAPRPCRVPGPPAGPRRHGRPGRSGRCLRGVRGALRGRARDADARARPHARIA
jgi:AcrR family transcriptional regulator